jgi:sulfur carrier protein
MMEVTLNGDRLTIDPALTVDQLLASRVRPGAIFAVELNGDILPREYYGHRQLEPGDVLEVVTLVGGG